jgi:hypothetical protein
MPPRARTRYHLEEMGLLHRTLHEVLIRSRRLHREQSGQAVVESAIVIPLMVFLILGLIQLVMIQHAKIMTEYAAFNAARAGIVWNADQIIMENAAIISLLPTYEGLFKESDIGNPGQMLKRILQRALLYQVNRRLPQAIDLLKNGAGKVIEKIPIGSLGQKFLNKKKDELLDKAEEMADQALQKAITGALGAGDDRMVTVNILAPTQGAFGQRGREIDFDDFNRRNVTRLSIEVRYLYLMRVPFANWVIHQAWMTGMAGKQLYGAIWNPQEDAKGKTGFRTVAPVTANSFGDDLLNKLDGLAGQGVYMVPLTSSYTMRMQSNPYKQSLQVK